MPRQLRREDYTVGWVCALPVELAAAQEMLDEEHGDPERDLSDNDENLYALGSIGGHNVAIVCLPAGQIGNNPAAAVATQMRATFKGIRFGLMVGIGGGVPSAEADIRLGDVVISQPHRTFGGVVQYGMGKTIPSGFQRTGSLNSPPQMLLEAVARVRANELRGRSRLSEHVSKLGRIPKFQRGKTGPDVLFEAIYDHKGGQTCERCSTDRQEIRQPRENEEEVVVHYGTIASGNQVMKNAAERDKVSAELGGVLCFEMEAAGLMNSFPCLVIRGICDYADSHKNKRWQAYAAGTAAGWAKEVLSVIPPIDVAKAHTAEEAIRSASRHVTIPTYYKLTLRQTLKGHSGMVRAVAFSPDGKVLASGSGDKTIMLRDGGTGAVLQTLKGHSDSVLQRLKGHSSYVRAVAFSPDGKVLASGSENKTIKLWDSGTGAVLKTLKGHSGLVRSVAFSPDGKVLASGSIDKKIKLWDSGTGEVLQTLKGHSGWVNSVAFSPDGKVLASGSDDTEIKIWEINWSALRQTLKGHSGLVNAVAFSPDGKVLASGSNDKTVKLWDAQGPFGLGQGRGLLAG